jgi:hypothetical protein
VIREFFTDISAGNILLTETQDNDGLCGFISNLEFARIQSSTLRRRTIITSQHTTFESTVAVQWGAGMTVS